LFHNLDSNFLALNEVVVYKIFYLIPINILWIRCLSKLRLLSKTGHKSTTDTLESSILNPDTSENDQDNAVNPTDAVEKNLSDTRSGKRNKKKKPTRVGRPSNRRKSAPDTLVSRKNPSPSTSTGIRNRSRNGIHRFRA
jgi:hypothetical protein